MKTLHFHVGAFLFFLCAPVSGWGQAAEPVLIERLGGAELGGWTNVEHTPDGSTLRLPGTADFRYPQGARGWYRTGFRTDHDGTRDWRPFYGLQMEVLVPPDRALEIEAAVSTPPPASAASAEYLPGSRASLTVHGGANWQRVTLPWTAFDYNRSQGAFLRFIQALRLTGRFADDGPAGAVARVRNVRLVRAPSIELAAPVLGKAVAPGASAAYEVSVGNCTDTAQTVRLTFGHEGWETMPARIEPSRLELAPGATASCVVTVQVPEDGVPPGGHERQTLRALGADDGAPLAQIEFVTARDVPRPSILHTPQGWADVRAKVAHYDWARKSQQEDYVKVADAWKVPSPATAEQRAHGPEDHPYVFLSSEFKPLAATAVAWQLTRQKGYAEKVATFLRGLADEKTGYASTLAMVSQGEPQEGENWQVVGIAFDAILDAGVLTDDDRRAIEHAIRLYLEVVELPLTVGNVGNWSTAGNTGALFCALALGDLAAAERYIHGPGGFTDYVTKGIMDDGWWWECSSSYNFWVAAELTQSALACQPWGIDLLHQEQPASNSVDSIINPWALAPRYGLSFEKWGPARRNTRSVKQLWDAVPAAADYRGITFGMNDGHEELVAGSRLELAYYAFRDPLYAAIIKQGGQRDLIYGVPELPADTPATGTKSGYAENIGYALLRSQTADRPVREQITAALKIGTQGGFHGHFDRASLNTIMRYGRSFWNPESIWWGYPNFMYKFFVQTSLNHNMVVVDQQQQEAVPSSQLLFHSGRLLQAAVHETNARWSDPPYGGMQYDPKQSFTERARANRQSLPHPDDRSYGDLGPWSDRVRQRRLVAVTDDYIVVADDVKSSAPHTFDNLFQMQGFTGLDAADQKCVRHDAQLNPDPHGAAQFVTDCQWYQASAPVVSHFVQTFGPGEPERKTDHNEPGTLKIDVHSAWPAQQEILLATPPEKEESQWVSYTVSGDGKTLAQGESGMWILGAVDVDVPVENVGELALSVLTDSGKKKSLFWSHARLVTADDQEIPLGELPTGENVAVPPQAGRDYYGGPVKIAGEASPDACPTQPADPKKPGVIRLALTGKNAVRFRARLGGDYPLGDEAPRRKVYGLRSHGTAARFLTVLEPYEGQAAVRSVRATSPDALRVELADGRVQELAISQLDGDGKDIVVTLTESKDGQIVRTENTRNP